MYRINERWRDSCTGYAYEGDKVWEYCSYVGLANAISVLVGLAL